MGNGVGEHQQHYEGFAPNVIRRLEALERFAKRTERLLFEDEDGKPALATIAYKVNTHVNVLCDYAATVGKVFRGLVRLLKLLAIALGSASVIWLTWKHFGDISVIEALGKLL